MPSEEIGFLFFDFTWEIKTRTKKETGRNRISTLLTVFNRLTLSQLPFLILRDCLG